MYYKIELLSCFNSVLSTIEKSFRDNLIAFVIYGFKHYKSSSLFSYADSHEHTPVSRYETDYIEGVCCVFVYFKIHDSLQRQPLSCFSDISRVSYLVICMNHGLIC